MALPLFISSRGRDTVGVLFLFVLLMAATERINGDPEALWDFCVADTKSASVFMNGLACLNPNEASPRHFMTSALRTPGNPSANPIGVSTVGTNPQTMLGLNTLGITMNRIEMAVVSPHIHPRASEIIYLIGGTVSLGFVDSTTDRLFSATIEAGDVFVMPKGTGHYIQNVGGKTASMLVAFNSQNPGFFNVPSSTFVASNPCIPQEVLAKSFAMSLKEVEQIRKIL